MDALSKQYKKLLIFHPKIRKRIISREGNKLEFKESFNWNSRDQYTKSFAAFSNHKGGYLIFGVKNKPRDLIGLQSANFEDLDEAKIAEYLNNSFSPEINFEKIVIEIKNKKIGILNIQESANKPVVCIKTTGQIREADIYYRYNARSEKIKYPELKNLIDSVKECEQKNWMNLFERITKIGSDNAAILNVLDGKIKGQKGTLIIDKKLIPKLKFIKEGDFRKSGWPTLKLIGDIKPNSIIPDKKSIDNEVTKISITDDPSAPMVKIEEANMLKEFCLGYNQLIGECRKRYNNFKTDARFHAIKNNLKKSKSLCNTRYLDPQNPKSSKKDFFSKKIFKELEKYYKKN